MLSLIVCRDAAVMGIGIPSLPKTRHRWVRVEELHHEVHRHLPRLE